jgi:integrase
MQRKNLTEEGVAKLKAPSGKQFQNYHDGLVPGLVLRVSTKGRKSWVAQYYVKAPGKDGKRITMATTKALGVFPVLSVKKAREAARLFLADPHKALAQADSGSFREVAETFVKRHVEANGLRSKAEIERLLTRYVYPKWGNRPFREIKRGDVADLLDTIQDKNGARQADVVLAVIRKLMNWFAARNDDYVVPVVRGMHRSNGSDHRRKRILNDDEIKALWTACDAMTDKSVFGALVKVLLLTAQRREKVSTMQWADIANGVWTIPTEAREKANAGSLTLPQTVQDIIEEQPRFEDNPYVFAGRGDAALNSFSQCKAALDKLLPGMEPWTLHDLRRTAKSLMARAGVLPHVSERVLGHAIAGVEGVYDRHGYDAEKADALQRLADLVDRIVNPPEGANVVPLRR